MSKKINLATALFLSLSSFNTLSAENDKMPGWTYMTETNEFVYHAKNGSIKKDKAVLSMIIQQSAVSSSSNSMVMYMKFSVPTTACKDEYGVVTVSELSGKTITKSDYVKGGSSAASSMADILCYDIQHPN